MMNRETISYFLADMIESRPFDHIGYTNISEAKRLLSVEYGKIIVEIIQFIFNSMV